MLADSAKPSHQEMAAVSTILSICAVAPALLAGREEGFLIKPLVTQIGQCYGADSDGNRKVFDGRWCAFTSLYFFVFFGRLSAY